LTEPPRWAADVELTAGEAARLVASELPELAPVSLTDVGSGFDVWAYRDGDRVFRFPRRQFGADCIEREIRVLPSLAPHLPLPIPVALHVARPSGSYRYPFVVCRFIEGQTADRVELDDADRLRLAGPLAAFLGALHGAPIEVEPPGDDIGRSDLVRQRRVIEQGLERVAAAGLADEVEGVAALVDDLCTTAGHGGPPVWVHGDLYARHLILDGGRGLHGVIDWGDVHAGDPALDLSIGYGFLFGEARGRFFAEYGREVDEAMHRRARLRALHYGVLLLDYAWAMKDEPLLRSTRTALRFARSG
jgi:aminoglycoside phosphotransferase (APT) family kinase protein